MEIKKHKFGESIYGLRNIYDDTITKKKIEIIKEHIQEISENIGGSVATPIPLISTANDSVGKSINKYNYIALKKNEHYVHMMLLAIMFYLVDRGYSLDQISINDFDYYVGLFAVLAWIMYLIFLATRKWFELKVFNAILCLQLGYFLFRIFLETDKFVFSLVGLIIVFIITIRSSLIKL